MRYRKLVVVLLIYLVLHAYKGYKILSSTWHRQQNIFDVLHQHWGNIFKRQSTNICIKQTQN